MKRSGNVLASAAALCLVGVLAPWGRLHGQTVRPQGSEAAADSQAAAPQLAAPLLDAPVRREEYVLGPGDVLDLSAFGEASMQYRLTVSPEGVVRVPRLGNVQVQGLTLDAAQTLVERLLARYYRGLDVRLTLETVRSFKVYVLGDVPNPGIRTASAAMRVSELLPFPDSVLSRRRLVEVRRSGDTLRVDLARFRQTGELRQNPLLREGDVIVVPVSDATVAVFGHLAFPGAYQYRPGETLAELLTTANGNRGFLFRAADTLYLSRFAGGERREEIPLSRAEAMGERGRSLVLAPFDAVYLPAIANYREQYNAVVQGQVRHPGIYPIEPGRTLVSELITMAGGFTEEASLAEATLRRATQGSDELLRRLEEVPPESLSPEEQTMLRVLSQTGPQNVVIDFARLFESGVNAVDQVLQSGDVLSVPRRQNQVVVLGAVREPGIVAHVATRGANTFVSLAGGYARNAHKSGITVVRARTGARVPAEDVRQIEPGDRIIVPYKEHRTLLERVQTVQGVLGAISAVVLSVIGVREILR